MNNIEIVKSEKYGPVVSSRTVAEELGKRHSHVIRNLEKVLDGFDDKALIDKDIILSHYTSNRNKKCKEYLVTNKGLIMYVDSFNSNEKLYFFTQMIIENSNEPLINRQGFMKFENLFETIKKSIIEGRGELFYQKVFKENVYKLFENVKVIDKKYDKNNIPDCFLILNGLETPVEMKKNDFDLKALDQLQRYMQFYNCNQGLAIGKKLTTILPENIMFLDIKELEKFINNVNP